LIKNDVDLVWKLTKGASSFFLALEVVESTNSWALRNALPEWGVVLSQNQTAGRGRWGRAWNCEPGRGLALSVGVPVGNSQSRGRIPLEWASLVSGACLSRSLRNIGVKDVGMKWPNDILVGSRKLSGILVEIGAPGQAIVGVGINVRRSINHYDDNRISLEEVLDLRISSLDSLVSMFLAELRSATLSTFDEVQSLVLGEIVTIGRQVRVHEKSGRHWSGFAVGVDDSGSLLVRDSHGRVLPQTVTEIQHLLQ
jgi:BirA family transcriptional regulator, biotin operon repressor / biotin---[acetyl-CoA-carboxylase] ligase